ncbi:flavoprotein [Helicovermis profundi]|uniref:Flavoprotein domain-containing protein n=1 Tax=Helicovermis profundi TaxID=3065157 RepID=A0AAU9E0P8_9FIRM|nr:hypothetical protein HLPR_02850 [Clostridia bacterium S502]
MSNIDKMRKAFEKLAFPVYDGSQLNAEKVDIFSTLKDKRVTVILTGSDTGVDDALKKFKFLKEKGFYITAVLSKAAENIITKERIEKEFIPNRIIKGDNYEGLKNLVLNTDYCILPNLTQNSLSKVSLGIQDDLVSILLWQYLVSNIKTIINTDAIFHGWFPIDENKKMKQVMENHLKNIEDFGAIFVNNQDFLDFIDIEYEENDNIINTSKKEIKESKLITEAAIRDLDRNTREIIITKGTIITPLAKDLASTRKIKIIVR